MSQTKRKRPSVPSQVRYKVDTSKHDFDEIITLPYPDDSGCDNSGSDAEWDEEVPEITYKLACKTYTGDQAKLEGNHDFCWADGEKRYPDVIEDNILLKESAKKNIQDSEPVELFETFFSVEIKQYIIDTCKENEFDLQLQDLNTFLGIIIVTSFNKRKSQRDCYWLMLTESKHFLLTYQLVTHYLLICVHRNAKINDFQEYFDMLMFAGGIP